MDEIKKTGVLSDIFRGVRNQIIDECLEVIKKHDLNYTDWNMYPEHEIRFELCCGVTDKGERIIREIEKLKGAK